MDNMNLEEKKKRIAELRKIDYLSDQECEELERLKDEVLQETGDNVNKAHQKLIDSMDKNEKIQIEIKSKENEKPVTHSLIKKLLRVTPKQPVTQAEIEQLKLVAQKEELKSRIAKAKGARPNIIERFLGKSTHNPFEVGTSNTKKRSDYDPFRW